MSQKRIAKISISVLQDDVADAAPVVEAPVEELQLRRARLEGEKAQGGAEQGGQLSLPRREGLFLDEAPPSQGGGSFIIRKPRARVARRIPDHDVVNGADVQPQLTEKVRLRHRHRPNERDEPIPVRDSPCD